MNHSLYLTLAWQSIRKNRQITLPFFAGSTLMVCMVYSMISLSEIPGIMDTFGGGYLSMILKQGSLIIDFFVLLFYFYLNSVWMKNRTQENGLYTILGMERHHLIRIVFYEMMTAFLITFPLGVLLGIGFEQIMSLLYQTVSGSALPMHFTISVTALLHSLIWIGLCYGLVLLYTLYSMLRSSPLEAMKGKNTAEKPITNRWILALLGVLSLGAGYWIAISSPNAVNSLLMFFPAVLLVIVGTYLLFLFGTTALCTILTRNKRFYYRTTHFLNLSSMRYRLKANASSLASIAILSTMLLVALSTTVTLLTGVDALCDSIYSRNTRVLIGALPLDEPLSTTVGYIDQSASKLGWTLEDEVAYSEVFCSLNDASGKEIFAEVIDLDDYNALTHSDYQLAPGELLVLGNTKTEDKTLKNTDGRAYSVVSENAPIPSGVTQQMMTDREVRFYAGVLSDMSAESKSQIVHFNTNIDNLTMEFEASGDTLPDDEHFAMELASLYAAQGLEPAVHTDFKETFKNEGMALYSGLFFIGVYVSVLFLAVVVLIMYYKQIREGYEDRERFTVLRNIGLDEKQTRRIINEQVLILFFAPLLVALLHISFAYPMILKILSALAGLRPMLFITVIAICFGIFALIYIIIYRLSARVYYRIACMPQN